jgi:hypothetical protein
MRFDRQATHVVPSSSMRSKGVERSDVTGTSMTQGLEVCEPVRTDHNCLGPEARCALS